jgi:AcrR family transcriptional regulator
MDASEKMKYKLAAGMKELMKHYPVEKITVKQIADQCDVTRPTFYRHFKDKYDLVNWHFDKLAQKSFRQMGISLTLRESLIKKFEFIKGEGEFFAAAFSCESQNCLMEYDYECIYQFYSDLIRKKRKQDISEETDFLLRMYCRGSISMTVEWATKGMKMSPEQMADQLIEALPAKLYHILKDV